MKRYILLILMFFFIHNLLTADPIGWKYKRQITLTPVTPENDYQVKIEINTNNFEYSHAKTDGADIRFYDTSENPLNYWIENWTVDSNSLVWVKVANAGTSMIYIYYGNSGANSESNGTNTFMFFDDFENYTNTFQAEFTNKWGTQTINNGTVNIETNAFGDKYLYIDTKAAGGPDSAGAYSKQKFSLPYIFEGNLSAYRDGSIYGDHQPRGMGDGLSENDSILFKSFNTGWDIECISSSNGTTTSSSYGGGSLDVYIWRFYKIVATPTNVKFYIDGNLAAAHSSNISTISLNILLHSSDGGFGNVPIMSDNIRIRKYSLPEPVATIGSEIDIESSTTEDPLGSIVSEHIGIMNNVIKYKSDEKVYYRHLFENDGEAVCKIFDITGNVIKEIGRCTGYKGRTKLFEWNGKSKSGKYCAPGYYILVVEINGKKKNYSVVIY